MEIKYTEDEEGNVVVRVSRTRATDAGRQITSALVRDFGVGRLASERALAFIHQIHTREIKLDDLLPPHYKGILKEEE